MSSRVPASNVVRFLHTIEQLKRTKRTGWIEKQVKQPESISDHMHRMGIMAMLIDDPTLNRAKCVKMAIVHDLAEAVVGDITPHNDKVTKAEKHDMEKRAMQDFQDMLGGTNEAKEIFSLWQEYENATTPEALFVKDLDKFEMIVQALEYEKCKLASILHETSPFTAADRIRLDDFFASTKGKFKHPTVKEWVEALEKERKDFWKNELE